MKSKSLHRITGKILLSSMVFMGLLSAGCDDGRIYPDTSEIVNSGLAVTMKGELTGCGQYADTEYTVALAAFDEGNEFAVVSKNLNDGADDISMTNVDRKVSTVEVCIINRLRKRIITLFSKKVDAAEEVVMLNVGSLNVAPFSAISNDIFSMTCLQCHGGTERPAAGLDLNPERAYADIVGVPSKVMEGMLIVNPGDASASTLWEAVATDISESWRFDHSNLLPADKSSFIETWINNGADD